MLALFTDNMRNGCRACALAGARSRACVRAAIYETGRLSRQSRTRDDVFESSVAVECTPRLGASVRTTRDGRCVLASATCAHLHVSCPCASPWTYARTRLPRIPPKIGADEHLHTLTQSHARSLPPSQHDGVAGRPSSLSQNASSLVQTRAASRRAAGPRLDQVEAKEETDHPRGLRVAVRLHSIASDQGATNAHRVHYA